MAKVKAKKEPIEVNINGNYSTDLREHSLEHIKNLIDLANREHWNVTEEKNKEIRQLKSEVLYLKQFIKELVMERPDQNININKLFNSDPQIL